MSLSKYPEKLDVFETKRDAQFEGDPNGDNVMADDVNGLQDAVTAIEKALGVNPQGNKLSVGERITLLEGSSALRVPSFLIYLGNPALINESVTTLEAAGHFAKYDHVVLGNSAQDPSDPDYAATMEVISLIRASKDVKFYGYIDCGVNTLNLSISELQVIIQQWKDIDAMGIYCANFGFENRVSRERQNQILDSIHQHDMVAILDADNPEEVFTDLFHETMNPNWVAPNIQDGDIYHYNQFALDSSRPGVYEPNQLAAINTLIKLYEYRVAQGIKIFATPIIQTNVDKETAQKYYDYAHVTALVTSMDAFHPVIEGYGVATNTAPTYDWMPIAGNWYMASPRIEYDEKGEECVRELPFGRIFLNTAEHTYRYEGLYIPYELLRIAENTIEGNLLKDNTVEDRKIKNYKGSRLIDAINNETEDKLIDIKKIMKISYGDLSGSVSVDALTANVINAINANIGFATIGAAIIGDLTADKITAGTIDAGRITASVIEAINLYAENLTADSAFINTAVIKDLSAEKITAGTIDAERISASVVEAINLSAEQGYIKNLNADNITAGQIKAERIWSDVVNAINLYTDNMVVGSAKINSASIGDLTAGHMRGSVVEAINLSADTAIINSAKISALSADHIKASVIDAINANITNAQIQEAVIGDLSASKITAGTLDADRIKGSVIEAINLYAQELTADSARLDTAVIKDLSADKITSGDIQTERLSANIVNAVNAYAKTMTAESAKIDVATIGALQANHMAAAVIEAINASIENAVIEGAKIGTLTVDSMKANIIRAVNASIEDAFIDQARIGDLKAEKITTGTLAADIIKGSVITAINGSFENLTIDAAQIGTLSADHMKAGVIEAVNGSFENITIDAGKIGSLKAENIQAEVIKAINASVEDAVIDSAQIGILKAENMQAEILKAINASIETAVIDQGKIGNLDAAKITAGDIDADRLTANVVAAINSEFQTAVIEQAKIGNLDAEKITAGDINTDRMKANIVYAINAYVETMTANSAKINSAAMGTLDVSHMQARVIDAVNAYVGTAKINNAKIDVLTAGHIEAEVIDAINANLDKATIKQGVIEDLSAEKIVTGDLKAEVMTANAISAINADLTEATIDAAQIGELTAEHIQAEIIKAVNASIETATIDGAKIGQLEVESMKAGVISAINGSFESLTIDSTKIGSLTANHIKAQIIEAINASVENITINSAKVGMMTAEHIRASVITAINSSIETAKIGYARIGELRAENIGANAINANHIASNEIISRHIKAGELQATHIASEQILARHIKAGEITSDHITVNGLDASIIKSGYIDAARIKAGSISADRLVAGSITGREIAAKTLTAREIATGAITSNEIQAGSISAEHISTKGLDAQQVNVYNAKTGETLIGGGYLRVDGLDAGVVQSDNLVANGMFMTASSAYGIKRTNPTGEVIIGTESKVPGGNQIWKYDLETGEVVTTIDIPGKKPAFIAIDFQQKYGYATVQGNDTLIQLDLDFDTITENFRPMGKAPSRVKWTGNILGDMKHLFVVNSDQTDITSPDSFYVLDVPPHSDFSQLYIHHQLVLGNGPYDFVLSEKDKYIYITLKDQGDIAIIDASNPVTWNWKQIGAIPIAPYGTDNYHGGLEGGFGIGHAVGGDSSAEYNLDGGHAGHGGHSHGSGGGYSVSDGTMMPYEPHGIAIDSKENLLLVTDAVNNQLVVISRIPKEQFDWPVHKDYENQQNIDWIAEVSAHTDKYDNNPELAVADGYTTISPYVPFMGYHFVKAEGGFDPEMPNTLMYVLDTSVEGNAYRLIGAEWSVPDNTIPSPIPGKDWELAEPAMAHYEDGLTIEIASPDLAPAVHPETGSAFTHWTPAIYGVHFYHKEKNPLGMFEAFNPVLEPYNSTNPTLPAGFESIVDPSVPDSDWHTYVPPVGGVDNSGGGGGHDHHSMSVGEPEIVAMAEEEPIFEAMHSGHTTTPSHDHGGGEESIGPDTTGQGTVWKWVMSRIPIGDTPEFVEVFDGKVFVTLLGDNHVVVMDETDLYRTTMDITQESDWNKYLRDIVTGSRPMDMIKDRERNKLYVTVNGTNEIAVIDPITETVEKKLQAGANVMGGAITPDGKYLYVANNGGVGSMTFVYPEGAYIGDAFIGLEGDINYQGALYWTPDRSDWVHNLDGTLRSSSTVEFRINEPFLNEGGYVRLATQGVDEQYAQIEQDIFNVSNFSNGDNFADAKKERLEGNVERTLWYPNSNWIEADGVHNIKIVQMIEQEDKSVVRIETIPDPSTYIIHYDVPRIEFQAGVVPETAWVEADYVFRANVWFKSHNASVLVAIENSSSKNFNTLFEVDEYVPKFITMDALQTKPFDYEPIVHPGETTGHYEGLKYSYVTNRAKGLPAENVTLSSPQIDTGAGQDPCVALDGDANSSNYVELPEGPQSYTIDLGGKFMVGAVQVWHFWQDGRTYHNSKTEISEDGLVWETIFDSSIEGEYAETAEGRTSYLWAYENKPKNLDENYVAAKPIRYVRDTINGNTVNNRNHWVEIQVFADWELEEDYVYPENTANEGEQIATNGKGVVTTDISGASITVDLKVDFTSWWYMTYLVGPEFGQFDVEMPTVMGGSHVLPVGNPYINKVAHKHIMSFPPGSHQTVIKQKSGKVAMDRFRFEDYQYFDRSATLIPATAGTTFTRYKIVPEQARDYVGKGNQSTEGPYDTPRVNPDTKKPDGSVAIKYRFRVKSILSAAGHENERGVAYVTSAIMEQGKLSSHWRPSAASDMTPGNRIESWDGNQPAKTGIQWFHLANGAVRGPKILPSAIMDYHISPYAKIGEYKLDLKYPTHQHGHMMMRADGSMYFMDNKDIIDGIMGWGDSGTSNKMARADHGHSHLVGDLMIHGNLSLVNTHELNDWALINNVNVWQLNEDFNSHIANTDMHITAEERTKLANVRADATKVEASTNGRIKINGADTVVYAHPTGDGNNHIPSGGASGNVLKYSASGVATWSNVSWSEVTGKPSTFTPSAHEHLAANIKDLNTVLSAYATKEDLADAGGIKTNGDNVFSGQNMFVKSDGPAVIIKPSTEPNADTVLMQIANTLGGNLLTVDAEGDVVIEANLTVKGTTTYNGTNEVQGDYAITGNLTVDGSTVLGSSSSDQTTVRGNLVVDGSITQKGKSIEVGRFPVFGAGDLQFQTDSTVYEDIIGYYSTFATGDSWGIPSPQSGATRKYRLMVSYSTVGESSDAKLRIVQYGNTTVIGSVFTLPTVNGSATGMVRHFRTPEFTTSYTGNTMFQAMSAGAGKDLIIKHIEVIAYDYFA